MKMVQIAVFFLCVLAGPLVSQVFAGQNTVFITKTDPGYKDTQIDLQNTKNRISYIESLRAIITKIPTKSDIRVLKLPPALHKLYFAHLVDLHYLATETVEVMSSDILDVSEISNGLYSVAIDRNIGSSIVSKLKQTDDLGVIVEVGTHLFLLESKTTEGQNVVLSLRSSDGKLLLLVLPLDEY